MVSNPDISVIIPCFNTPKDYIVRACDSVTRQESIHFEIILVDDGSLPIYHTALEELAEKDDRIHLITTENGGVSSARNIAVNKASGQYVAFLDSDDVITSSFLRNAYAIAELVQADYIIGGVRNTTEISEKELDMPFDQALNYKIYEGEEIKKLKPCFLGPNYQICYDECYINRGPVARLLKTELAKRVPFNTSVKLGEDVIWNQELLDNCNKVCIVDEVWYIYWHNPHSASYQFSEKYLLEWEYHLVVLKEMIDLENADMFSSYCSRIMEGMKNIWFGYLRYLKKQDKTLYKKIWFKLYKTQPWNSLSASNKLRNSPGKMKIKSYLYKCKFLFVIWSLVERNNN